MYIKYIPLEYVLSTNVFRTHVFKTNDYEAVHRTDVLEQMSSLVQMSLEKISLEQLS